MKPAPALLVSQIEDERTRASFLNPSDMLTSSSVSVVMAVHNGYRFLGEQLTSLLADLQPCDELIVVVGSSTDDSFAMLQSLSDIRVKLVRNDSNQGVRRSFERGLRMATNEVIFLCDQDDRWRVGKRRAFVEAFDDDELCLVVISDASLIDAESRQIAVGPTWCAIDILGAPWQ